MIPPRPARAGEFHRAGYLPVDHAGAVRGAVGFEVPPCPLLVKYVEAGWLGRKTNRGFYDYTQTPPRPTR
jgi:3-hydroxyacyl-CoA dehydrogenase